MPYYVYILSSRSRNLYTGVTNNLTRRVAEHRQGLIPGFTSRYRIHRLVYYEPYRSIRSAIEREKQIKGWLRAKKVALIEKHNPTWDDLAADWFAIPGGKNKTRADSSLRSE
ncbi:MAG: endonuclease [Acidobacteria bacterium RIFCSPLOWO2_12_FULL_54_10]|nr:MAG: endonuclease [Acidobacteria bacterium RIFCSPLOWO2_12_FULL_54_10]